MRMGERINAKGERRGEGWQRGERESGDSEKEREEEETEDEEKGRK